MGMSHEGKLGKWELWGANHTQTVHIPDNNTSVLLCDSWELWEVSR